MYYHGVRLDEIRKEYRRLREAENNSASTRSASTSQSTPWNERELANKKKDEIDATNALLYVSLVFVTSCELSRLGAGFQASAHLDRQVRTGKCRKHVSEECK